MMEIANELLPQLSTVGIQLKEEIINALLDMISAKEYMNLTHYEWLVPNLKIMILNCPRVCEQRLAEMIRVIYI